MLQEQLWRAVPASSADSILAVITDEQRVQCFSGTIHRLQASSNPVDVLMVPHALYDHLMTIVLSKEYADNKDAISMSEHLQILDLTKQIGGIPCAGCQYVCETCIKQ
jgi:hypothetical protein